MIKFEPKLAQHMDEEEALTLAHVLMWLTDLGYDHGDCRHNWLLERGKDGAPSESWVATKFKQWLQKEYPDNETLVFPDKDANLPPQRWVRCECDSFTPSFPCGECWKNWMEDDGLEQYLKAWETEHAEST